MKICFQCATPYPDEAFAACPTCELIEASLRPAATAAVPDDQLKAELGALQAAVYGAAAADTLVAERPAEAVPLSFVAPATGEPEPPAAAEGEITLERLEALRRSGRMVIGLLGFPTAGKTWFLNRLKDNWEQPGNTANPPKAPGGSRVGATQDVAEHVFLKPGGGFYILDLPGERFEAAAMTTFRNDPLLLAAINACGALAVILPADEALFSGRAASRYEAQGDVVPAGGVSLDEVVAAAKATLAETEKELARVRRRVKTDASEVNIAALEAALAARDAAKAEHRDLSARLMSDKGSGLAQAHQRLEAFISGLGRVSGLLSLQASGHTGPLGPDEVDRHVMSDAFRPFPKPICIALSKADSILDEKGLAAELTAHSPVDRVWRDKFDRDPLATIHHFRPTLARQFDRWFRWVKFDFLTAFGGHRGGELINYDLKCYGVNGIVEWMDWIARHDTLPPKDQRILADATAWRRARDLRPQDNSLTSLGGAAGAGRAARRPNLALRQPQVRAALKAVIDALFSKRSGWAPLAVCGVAAALWLSTVAASTGLIPGAPPAAVKDETAQFILKAATTTGSTLPPDVCAQSQNAERRLARAWAIRLSHSCPGPMNAPKVWPLVIAFGAWLGIPLTLGLIGVLTGVLALVLPRWLAVRRAYGKLFGSDHYADSLADRTLAAKARSQG